MPRVYDRNNNPTGDLRDMLLAAGVGQYTASMAIQFMNFLPTTTDPYAAGTIELVKGLQRLLNQRGAKLAVDGGLGEKTAQAFVKYAGPRWMDKSWAQIYGDVLRGETWEGFDRRDRGDLAAYEEVGTSFVGDLFATPLPWVGLAALGYWYVTRSRR